MKLLKFKRNYLSITTLILVLSSIFLFNTSKNENIEKSVYYPKTLEQEGETYRLVTSADNVQVPVPKGYVASRVTGENYVTPAYRHTTNSHRGNYTELTWSSPAGEQYPWTQDENGIWISGNQGIPNSTSTLETEFDYIKGTTLTINYTHSNPYGDYLIIDLINQTNNTTLRILNKRYGNANSSFDYINSTYTWKMDNGETGRYKIRVIYSKDNSGNSGLDSCYIKPSTYFKKNSNGTEVFEEEIKTRIHDGGFVIYQLEDEEIERDPNGTNVIINDTNKDEEQGTRNQYVWVPVSNIEDIIKTTTYINGIMQFGQTYLFNSTAIRKDNIYYYEPMITENSDKTKHYLQRYSNIKNRDSLLNNIQEDFARMIKSINKYKGFYIGRYETGDDYEHDSSKGYFKNPKVVRYNSNLCNITWYDSYIDLERLAKKTGKYVETGIIYMSLFDYSLKWLNETNTRSYKDIGNDGGTWGNYNNNRSKYKEAANETEKTKEENLQKMIPTGGITEIIYNGGIYSDSPTASNNIFDIAGNVDELTMAFTSHSDRGYKGNSYNNQSNGNTNPGKIFVISPYYSGFSDLRCQSSTIHIVILKC